MKKNATRFRLKLNTNTVRLLTPEQVRDIAGGGPCNLTGSCTTTRTFDPTGCPSEGC